MKPLKIAILETGTPNPVLRESHGGYPDMFVSAFERHQELLTFENFNVYENNLLPELEQYDGFLITGSPLGVYEDHDFVKPLEKLIQQGLAKGKPMVGICFGHQIMATAMGGRVEKVDKGWGVGIHHYNFYESKTALPDGLQIFAKENSGKISCLVSHQDQVVGLSDQIYSVGGSSFCPNGVLVYGKGNGISFQMHPEFEIEFAAELLASRTDEINRETVEMAQKSFSAPSDRNIMIDAITQFFVRSCKQILV